MREGAGRPRRRRPSRCCVRGGPAAVQRSAAAAAAACCGTHLVACVRCLIIRFAWQAGLRRGRGPFFFHPALSCVGLRPGPRDECFTDGADARRPGVRRAAGRPVKCFATGPAACADGWPANEGCTRETCEGVKACEKVCCTTGGKSGMGCVWVRVCVCGSALCLCLCRLNGFATLINAGVDSNRVSAGWLAAFGVACRLQTPRREEEGKRLLRLRAEHLDSKAC